MCSEIWVLFLWSFQSWYHLLHKDGPPYLPFHTVFFYSLSPSLYILHFPPPILPSLSSICFYILCSQSRGLSCKQQKPLLNNFSGDTIQQSEIGLHRNTRRVLDLCLKYQKSRAPLKITAHNSTGEDKVAIATRHQRAIHIVGTNDTGLHTGRTNSTSKETWMWLPQTLLLWSQMDSVWFQLPSWHLWWINPIGEVCIMCPTPNSNWRLINYLEILASSWEVGCASQDGPPSNVGKWLIQMVNSWKKSQMPALAWMLTPTLSSFMAQL